MFEKSFGQLPRHEDESQDFTRASNILRRLEKRLINAKEMFLGGDDENITISRREFLRKASDIGAGVVIGASVGGGFHLTRYFLSQENVKEDNQSIIHEGDSVSEAIKEVPLSEAQEVEAQETSLEKEKITENPLDEVFNREDMQGVVFDEELMRKASLYWKYMHIDGARNRDLSEGYERMNRWEDRVCSIFEEEGVPRELAYLALPESYWNEDKWTSPVGAVGPYQIMKSTGKAFGVGSEEAREDPLKSARAVAQILQENYKRMDNDWQLALCAYNGGFAWDYRKAMSYNNLSYPDFLRYMTEEIQKESEYEVKSGDVLGSIARKFGCSVKEIQERNELSNDVIQVGQKLSLPGGISEKGKRNMEENLNYVPKVEGILLALKEKGVLEENAYLKPRYVTLEEDKIMG